MNFKDFKIGATKVLQGLLPHFAPDQGRRPIELDWGREKLRFETPADFEFALSARTSVPPSRLQELMQRSGVELETEAQDIHRLEQRIGHIVAAYDSVRQPCGPAIAHIGVAVFSKDYDWRTVFTRLIELPSECDSFKRAALIKYLQYLNARHGTVRLVIATKTPTAAADEHARATVMLAASALLYPFERDELRRLPQGEAVTLHLARGSAISLKLAKHVFSLIHNREWTLVAADGKTYTLPAGVNRVGRGRDNDVALDADFRNVSRQHLLAQPLADDVIVLTDISAHGTYIPPTALAS